MKIHRHLPSEGTHRFGTIHQELFADVTLSEASPFRLGIATIEPGSRSTRHLHLDKEIVVVVSGSAAVEMEEHVWLYAGDAILIPPLVPHSVLNISPDVDLHYIRYTWGTHMSDVSIGRQSRTDPLIIFATPPTPNGDLHLGHLSGPYLRADILRRFCMLTRRQSIFLTGIDDHQSYVAVRAQKDGRSPEDTAAYYGALMQSSWKAADVVPDYLLEPRALKSYEKQIADVLKTLRQKGYIELKEAPAPYCENCERFLFEAHVSGGCPHCNSPSNGNACEVCCLPNDCHDLRSPTCTLCNQPASLRSYSRLYFKMSSLTQTLRRTLADTQISTPAWKLAQQMLHEGLPDISISHATDWGLPLPWEGLLEQRLYVWFEMAIAYAIALSEHEGTELKPLPGAKVVQFFGMDNAWFHTILFPAIYVALGWDGGTPYRMLTNEFLLLDSSKFSTSRNHAIWARDFLQLNDSDLVRFYLARVGPETTQTNFSLDSFNQEVGNDLALWARWLSQLQLILTRNHSSLVPEAGLWTADHVAFLQELKSIHETVVMAYQPESFSPSMVVEQLRVLVGRSTRFVELQQGLYDLAVLEAEQRTATALSLAALRSFAVLSIPIMPRFSLALLGTLGANAANIDDVVSPELVQPGLEIISLNEILPVSAERRPPNA